jgi:hypothetical protein
MNAGDPKVAWSIDVPNRLDDKARDALSADLGLSFHSVDDPHAYTIAHRFLEDDADTLLRIVQTRSKSYVVELVGFGTEVAHETASELERIVSEALGKLPSNAPEAGLETPLIERVSRGLASLAEQISATFLFPAALRPIEVLGELSGVEAGPFELVLPAEAQRRLGSDIRKRAVFDGSVVRVWISGSWVVPEQSRLVLYAIDPAYNVVSAETGIERGFSRLRLEMPWPHNTPPNEILLAVMPRD